MGSPVQHWQQLLEILRRCEHDLEQTTRKITKEKTQEKTAQNCINKNEQTITKMVTCITPVRSTDRMETD